MAEIEEMAGASNDAINALQSQPPGRPPISMTARELRAIVGQAPSSSHSRIPCCTCVELVREHVMGRAGVSRQDGCPIQSQADVRSFVNNKEEELYFITICNGRYCRSVQGKIQRRQILVQISSFPPEPRHDPRHFHVRNVGCTFRGSNPRSEES